MDILKLQPKKAKRNPGYFEGIDRAGGILSISRFSGFKYQQTVPHADSVSTTHDLMISTIPPVTSYTPSLTISLRRLVAFVQYEPGSHAVKAIVRGSPYVPGLSIQLNGDAVYGEEEEKEGRVDVSYEGKTFSSDFKYNSSGMMGVSHLHSIFEGFSVGVRSFFSLGTKETATMVGIRMSEGDESHVTIVGSNYGQYGVSLLQTVSNSMKVAVAYVYNEKSGSTMKLGYIYGWRKTLVKGVVDFTSGLVNVDATYRLTSMTSLTLSGTLDHVNNANAFGITVNVG